MKNIEIHPIQSSEYEDLTCMVGELLNEIMDKINIKAFNFDAIETKARAKELISKEKYWVFIAKDHESNGNVGFVSLYESYALYSEGVYGTIPELFVRPKWRSLAIGKALIQKAVSFGESKGWKRLEVTTPPLPEFDKTLNFYKANGFEISGGRKLKIDVNA
jgi:GNAT superfamily N-acetyltransferase